MKPDKPEMPDEIWAYTIEGFSIEGAYETHSWAEYNGQSKLGAKYIRADLVQKKADDAFHEGYEQAREAYNVRK